jgi:HAD superfamily hydrolase (TIGR01662 family)
MPGTVTTIFFDLGYTLINFEGNVDRILRKSYFALADALLASGYRFGRKSFVTQYQQVISRYYQAREENYVEMPTDIFVNRALACVDQPQASAEKLAPAIDAMFAVTEAHWRVEKDSHFALANLLERKYKLCIISNASNAKDLNRLVDKSALRPYFEHIVISAEEGVRKPDARIFEKALGLMQVSAAESLMVGDTLMADIFGAQRVGMRGVWITRRARRPDNSRVKKSIHPDFQISKLTGLMKILGE